MSDIDRVRQAIEAMFDLNDCSNGRMGTPEPLMGGFMCSAEFDDIGTLGDNADGVRIAETDTREYRRWHSINGRVSYDGWNYAFQGEWGTYGPLSEASDVLRLQVWAGRHDVPGDVNYAFDLEHDRLIAQSAVTRLHVAAEALGHVSDEVLGEVARQGNVPSILAQIERLAGAR